MEKVFLRPTLHPVVHQPPTPCKKTTTSSRLCFQNFCWEIFQLSYVCFQNLHWEYFQLSTFICLLSKPPLKKHPLSLSTPPAATPPRIQMHRGSQRHCRYGIRSIMLIPEFCWCDILVLTLLPGSFETCPYKGFFKELCIPILSESCRFWISAKKIQSTALLAQILLKILLKISVKKSKAKGLPKYLPTSTRPHPHWCQCHPLEGSSSWNGSNLTRVAFN